LLPKSHLSTNDFVCDYEKRLQTENLSSHCNSLETNQLFGSSCSTKPVIVKTDEHYVLNYDNSVQTINKTSSTLLMSGNVDENDIN
jgi:hypothetical protein